MGPARLLQLPLPDLPDHEGLYQENYMNQKRVLSPICCLCLGIFIITAKKVPKRESCMKNGENLKTKPKQKQTQKRGKKKKEFRGWPQVLPGCGNTCSYVLHIESLSPPCLPSIHLQMWASNPQLQVLEDQEKVSTKQARCWRTGEMGDSGKQ